MHISTVVGLLRHGAVSCGDFMVGGRSTSLRTQLRWANARSRLDGSTIRFEKAGLGPSGNPLFRFHDSSRANPYYFNSLPRCRLYSRGVTNRSLSLAKSYGLDLFPFHEGDVLVDVGANYGDLAAYLDQLTGVSVTYVGIEPGLDEFACMSRNCAAGNHHLFDYALSDFDGSADFYYSPDGADSSLEQPPFAVTTTYEVQVRTLDSLADEFLADRNRLRALKVEAEGSEIEVLRGATELLKRTDYVTVDMGFERGMKQESPAPEVISLLTRAGFEIMAVCDPGSLRFLFRSTTAIP